ncbi:hypothetical protein CHS0354_037895 [Potamilus streckersoni]|uniref:Kinesin motor domain-containing protein n=1 Tax=Potamilus streckersoni TaxID=2493646 RepID=A0AAE0W8P9_9BIVA|nr:hypothetical protein CHS0354_037895 [Potamilus streckersoni]
MGTLFECLKEARLEKYYSSFRARGITKSESLAKLSIQDCPGLGITLPEDKRRLVELISIVKAVYNVESYTASTPPTTRANQYARNRSPRKRNRSPSHNVSQGVTGRGLLASHEVQVHERPQRTNTSIHHLSQAGAATLLDLLSDTSESESSDDDSSHHSDYEPAIKHSVSAASTHNSSPLVQKTPVERIRHGKGYNYGVPGATASNQKSRSRTGGMRDEKIKVCVRKRPLNRKEIKAGDEDIVRTESTTTVIVNEPKLAVDLTAYTLQHEFIFDEVFDGTCTNEDVYIRAARPLINCLFDGGSATCFAYGQTGAGKTHTMIGSREVPGLYLLAAQDIFSVVESKQYGENIKVWVSFFEIYCGQLFDLLNKRNRLHAREDGAQRVCISGLTETEVKDAASMIQVLEYGNTVRSKGSTGVNPDSSRSHAVLQMEVRDERERRLGRISFIDLAGSERASDVTDTDRQTRMEGAEINQSLLALKECIRSIDQESRHKPFRQSKLTHILKDSFMGNSRTCMIANISPCQSTCEHTLNTLRYADRVKELKRGSGHASGHSNNVALSNILMNIPASGPSVFHSGNILCSSTPIRPQSSRQYTNRNSSVDLTFDTSETPIKGHGIKRKTAVPSSSSARHVSQKSPVRPGPQSRVSVVRHMANSRPNVSSNSESSDQTDTDSCNITGPRNKNNNTDVTNTNIPVVKSTDTDNDFPTTDFNNEEEMNDLNRTGEKGQFVTASVPVLSTAAIKDASSGLVRTVTSIEGASSSPGQQMKGSSVSASTPMLRQKMYTDSDPGKQTSVTQSSQQTQNERGSQNTLQGQNSFYPNAAVVQIEMFDPAVIPVAMTTKGPKMSDSSPQHHANGSTPSNAFFSESIEDDLLFDQPVNENGSKPFQTSGSKENTLSYVTPPSSARTQPRVPQDPSAEPFMPAALPAKSSDLATFSQRSPTKYAVLKHHPSSRTHTQQQEQPKSKPPDNMSLNEDTSPLVSRNTQHVAGSPASDYLNRNSSALQERNPTGESGLDSKYGMYELKNERSSANKTNLKREMNDPPVSELYDMEHIDSFGIHNPSNFTENFRSLLDGTNSSRPRTPKSEVNMKQSSAEPVSANWFNTPADLDTHVARSVVGKKHFLQHLEDLAGHGYHQSQRRTSLERAKSDTVFDEETHLKNVEKELHELYPIQKPSSNLKPSSNQYVVKTQSDTGIISKPSEITTLESYSRSTYGPSSSSSSGSSTHMVKENLSDSNIPNLRMNTNSQLREQKPVTDTSMGARPKYSSSANSVASKEDATSPVLREMANGSTFSSHQNGQGNTHTSDNGSKSSVIMTEKLQNGATFFPIHPQPVSKSRTPINKDIVHPTPVTKGTVIDGRGQTKGDNSNTADLKSQLVAAHEDQLATVTSLCKQEMKLLLGAKAGHKSFDEYIKKVNDILSQKMAAIQLLQDQMIAFQISAQDDDGNAV